MIVSIKWMTLSFIANTKYYKKSKLTELVLSVADIGVGLDE